MCCLAFYSGLECSDGRYLGHLFLRLFPFRLVSITSLQESSFSYCSKELVLRRPVGARCFLCYLFLGLCFLFPLVAVAWSFSGVFDFALPVRFYQFVICFTCAVAHQVRGARVMQQDFRLWRPTPRHPSNVGVLSVAVLSVSLT